MQRLLRRAVFFVRKLVRGGWGYNLEVLAEEGVENDEYAFLVVWVLTRVAEYFVEQHLELFLARLLSVDNLEL